MLVLFQLISPELLSMGYHDMDASEYRIQKEWKKENID